MPFILPANTLSAGGYDVANSLRFNTGSSDYLNRSPSSAGNLTTWTLSMWVKRSILGGEKPLFSCRPDGNNETFVGFGGSDTLVYKQKTSGSTSGQIVTNRVFRDTSAWYNLVFVYDINNGTAGDRGRLYVNGVRETSFSAQTNFSQNSSWNSTTSNAIGISQSAYFAGYMSEVCFIDGQALAADSFGEFDEDSGIWKPINVSGLTFGDNGFYLETKQSGTSQNSSGLGADTSGNDNHFAVNNLTAVDQSTDTCTTNFSTLNFLNYSSASKTYSFGNTAITASASNAWCSTFSNFAVSSGKWYTEYKILDVGSYSAIGVGYQPFNTNASAYAAGTILVGEDAGAFGWRNNGARPGGGSSLSSWTTNDILMIAIDMDNQKLYFGKNGTWETSGNPESGATGTGSIANLTANEDYLFVICPRGGGTSVNFGSPSFAISSGNADGNGYGDFEYAVPSGYYSLNTKNLAEYG